MPLIAVQGDPNSHGNGNLIISNNPGTVTIGGLKVALVNSNASGDNSRHNPGQTDAATGSGKVFLFGQPVHRVGDLRKCGATTVGGGQSKVFAG